MEAARDQRAVVTGAGGSRGAIGAGGGTAGDICLHRRQRHRDRYRHRHHTAAASIDIGGNPRSIALAPDGAHAYVTSAGNDSVYVIATATNTVITAIGVGCSPHGVMVTPEGSRAYVASYFGNSVSVIDTATNTVSDTVGVGTHPWEVSLPLGGEHLYVTNSDNVSLIDMADNSVTSGIAEPIGRMRKLRRENCGRMVPWRGGTCTSRRLPPRYRRDSVDRAVPWVFVANRVSRPSLSHGSAQPGSRSAPTSSPSAARRRIAARSASFSMSAYRQW
ncbi:YncE family protein [Streptomyces sp. NPDC048462]|uniref:YncE family protein n=1 Tax=Streptomyces sp. NPDC048462 TaxID=3365555 RepID=UPI0037177769